MQITRHNGPITSGGTQMLYVPSGCDINSLPEAALREFNARSAGQGNFDLDDGRARFGINAKAIREGIVTNGFYVDKFVISVTAAR